MPETKHTPGPWIIRTFPASRATYVMDAIPDLPTGQVVANVIATPNTNPAWEANARLIAAAPDHALILAAVLRGDVLIELTNDGKRMLVLKHSYDRNLSWWSPADLTLDEFGCPVVPGALRALLMKGGA